MLRKKWIMISYLSQENMGREERNVKKKREGEEEVHKYLYPKKVDQCEWDLMTYGWIINAQETKLTLYLAKVSLNLQ